MGKVVKDGAVENTSIGAMEGYSLAWCPLHGLLWSGGRICFSLVVIKHFEQEAV